MSRLGHDRVMAAKSTTEPPPLPEPAAPAQPNEHRFFTWMRSLGVVRQPGWIGGVSAGIADRLGIDPLIVRGIIVVIAVLGGPALLLYAAAWLLLPDHHNKIHLEELIKGRFEAPIAGIGVMILLSMLPLTQGFWFAGSAFWGEPYWDFSWGRAVWTILILASIIYFVIWIARRSSEPTFTPATTDDKPDTIPQPRKDASAFVATETTVSAPTPPAAAAPDASTADLAAWREQQALWKQQNAEWKAQQAATERELRQRRAAEARDRALASAAEAAEQRRVHQLANPRISAAVGWGAIGAAIVAGGIGSVIASGNPDFAEFEFTVGLAVAAIVLGISIVIAGALRRRSGILSFLAVLVILATIATAMVPRTRVLLSANANVGASDSTRYAQLLGYLSIEVDELSPPGEVTNIWQGSGTIQITVFEGAAAQVEVVSRSGQVHVYEYTDPDEMLGHQIDSQYLIDGMWHSRDTVGDGGEPVTIRIWQGNGDVSIQDMNRPVEEEEVQ
jgi:phage shock protein PspC (stress-responsive transcriptional regulator)